MREHRHRDSKERRDRKVKLSTGSLILLLEKRQQLHRFLRRRERAEHELQTFHDDVRACLSVTHVSHEGHGVVCGQNVDDRMVCGARGAHKRWRDDP